MSHAMFNVNFLMLAKAQDTVSQARQELTFKCPKHQTLDGLIRAFFIYTLKPEERGSCGRCVMAAKHTDTVSLHFRYERHEKRSWKCFLTWELNQSTKQPLLKLAVQFPHLQFPSNTSITFTELWPIFFG